MKSSDENCKSKTTASNWFKYRRNVKERIRLAKSTNEQAHIEDESSDNDNREASEIIDDANDVIGNVFYLIKNC